MSALTSEKDKVFEEFLALNELRVWESLSVYHVFLANTQVPDEQKYTEKLLQAYEDLE